MKYNDATKNAMLDGIDATFNNGQMRIWTGAAPGPAAAATGTKIAQGEMPADIFAAAATGAKALNAATSVVGLAAAGAGANMGYGRLLQDADDDLASNAEPRVEFEIGTEGAAVNITAAAIVGGEAEFTAAAHGITDGQIVRIAGHSVAAYNRKWIAHAVTANTFRVTSAVAVGAGGTARRSFHMTVDNVSVANGQTVNVNSFTLDIP